MKAAAMVGWSGYGRFEDLERTALRKLGLRRGARIDDSLLVDTDDPVSVARRLAFLPGVAWISVGYRFTGTEEYLKNLEALAKRYLSRGRTFSVSARVLRSRETAGDVVLAGNSSLLSAIRGAKVNEKRPHVRFRVSIEGARGASGVEIRIGPGGVPSSSAWVSCLVSGGERSSALAWMAALSGFSLRLVHSRTEEAALRQVAKLYSELSFRMDPTCLELVVLDGGEDAAGRIGGWVRANRGPVFAGFRPKPGALVALARAFPNLVSPLVLVQDEAVSATYRSLGIGRPSKDAQPGGIGLKALEATTRYSEFRFGGIQADSNEVIDAMKRR